jgi:hypothetical protein
MKEDSRGPLPDAPWFLESTDGHAIRPTTKRCQDGIDTLSRRSVQLIAEADIA